MAAELDRQNFPAKNRVKNPRPERGMFSSIVCAATWDGWHDGVSSWAVILGINRTCKRQPCARCWEFSAGNPDAICQPIVGDRTGHPVILAKAAFADVKNSSAETLKDFLETYGLPGRPMSRDRRRSGYLTWIRRRTTND